MKYFISRYIRRTAVLILFALLPLGGSLLSGCSSGGDEESVIKTTRLDDAKSRQDSLKKQKQHQKPKVVSFRLDETVNV